MSRVVLSIVVVLAVIGGTAAVVTNSGYTVTVVLPSATNVNEGSPLLVNGMAAGVVSEISVVDGKARLALDIDDEFAPLHAGATATVKWRALVGERYVEIRDGAADNAEIPAGGMLNGEMPAPMEIDQVLAALDEPTRKRLKSLVEHLDSTVEGSEQDVRETLNTAGPAVAALGDVLRGIGGDGEAIGQLVTQVNDMVGTLADGDHKVSRVVDNVSALASDVAAEREQLGGALAKLPTTLERADTVLGKVPAVVDDVAPLLQELESATARLPSVAANLEPMLADLRPLTARLRPTLAAADDLLGHTPALLDQAHAVVPGFNAAVSGLLEPLDFLRPYTPEAAGALTNWASAVASYAGSGNYARFNVSYGLHSVGANPGVVPPGYEKEPQPKPGSHVGQPWTDAYGSGVR